MTSTVDERGAEASRKFQVPLTTSLVSSLSMFASNIAAVSLHATRWSLEASFAVVLWVISAASHEACQNLKEKRDDEFERRWRSAPTGCGGRRP